MVLRTCVVLLTIFAALAAMKLADDIMAPLVAALVAGVMLAPATAWLERRGLPATLAVALVLIAGALFIASIALLAEPYFWQLVDRIPRIKWELQKLLREYRDLIQGIGDMNAEVAKALGEAPGAGNGAAAEMPTLMDALFFAPAILAQIAIFLGALFFFLLTRQSVYEFLSSRIGSRRDTDVIMARFRNAEKVISRYFLVVTIINTGLGVAVAGAMMALGLPGAIMWGAAAMMLNFVLFLGPATMIAALLLAGVVVFDGALSLAPAAAYLALNIIESQFLTPSLVGQRIAMNPLLIFVSLVFWLWLWGPIGGVIAIPVLVIVMKTFDILHELPTDDERARRAPPARFVP